MFRQSSLFEFKHGDHICVFYRDEEQLRQMLVPYIADGLRKGERCFCAQGAHFSKQLVYDLKFLGIDADTAIKHGTLEIHTEDEAYFPNKRFEPWAMMDMLLLSIDDAIARGYSGFRTAGELSWAAQGDNDCDQLLTYERMVEKGFAGRSAIGLCQYNVNVFSPEILDAVTESHRLNFIGAKPSCCHESMSMRQGNYNAEIVADKLVVDPKYYYVVQQNRPREVMGWGVAPTFDEANNQSERLMETSRYQN
jgi:hypothetical protein